MWLRARSCRSGPILDHATAMTAAAIADPASPPADIYRAADLEAAVLSAYWHAPGAQVELEAEP